MNKSRMAVLISMVMYLSATAVYAQSFDVNVRGVDDGVKTSKQQDYKEAVMNAKLQALERVENVDAIRKITNFQLRHETIEAKAKKVLLPGFQIVDVGYVEDGTYQVVLVGKIQKGGGGAQGGQAASGLGGASEPDQDIREALQLHKLGQTKKAIVLLDQAIRREDLDTRTQALFLKGLIYADEPGTLPRATRVLDELRAAQPDSPYIAKLETVTTYRYIKYRLVNEEHKIKKSKSIVDIQQGTPFSFTYKDETGKMHKITYPSGSACVNDECGKFERRGIKDRFEANVGVFNFFRTCKEWTNYTRAQMNDSAVDRVCDVTIERTDLSSENMMK